MILWGNVSLLRVEGAAKSAKALELKFNFKPERNLKVKYIDML
jgi:hypothetical protein